MKKYSKLSIITNLKVILIEWMANHRLMNKTLILIRLWFSEILFIIIPSAEIWEEIRLKENLGSTVLKWHLTTTHNYWIMELNVNGNVTFIKVSRLWSAESPKTKCLDDILQWEVLRSIHAWDPQLKVEAQNRDHWRSPRAQSPTLSLALYNMICNRCGVIWCRPT